MTTPPKPSERDCLLVKRARKYASEHWSSIEGEEFPAAFDSYVAGASAERKRCEEMLAEVHAAYDEQFRKLREVEHQLSEAQRVIKDFREALGKYTEYFIFNGAPANAAAEALNKHPAPSEEKAE